MSWDILPKANLQYFLQKLKTIFDSKADDADVEAITTETDITDTTPYLYRASQNSGDRCYLRQLVGASFVVNQLIKNISSDDWMVYSTSDSGITFNDGVATITLKNTLSSSFYKAGIMTNTDTISVIASHKYFVSYDIKPTFTAKFGSEIFENYLNPNYVYECSANQWTHIEFERTAPNNRTSSALFYFANPSGGSVASGNNYQIKNYMCIDLTQMLGTTIADYIYSLGSSNGIAWLKSQGYLTESYYPYSVGSLQSVNTSGKVNVGFNQWDEEWEIGDIDANTGAKKTGNYFISKNYTQVLSGNYYIKFGNSNAYGFIYKYNKDKQYLGYINRVANQVFEISQDTSYILFLVASYGTTYNNDICINISKTTGTPKNGDYVPYESHTTPISTIDLRGVPTLVDNNIVYDGDVRDESGVVTRKYGIVDLGTLTFGGAGVTSVFYCSLSGRKTGACKMIISNNYTYSNPYTSGNDKCYIENDDAGATQIYFKDSAYTSYTDFKTAMSGVYLVYELATPYTEQATPIQNPGIYNKFGWEQFIDNRSYPIPVGHNSEYVNLPDWMETGYADDLRDRVDYDIPKAIERLSNDNYSRNIFGIDNSPLMFNVYGGKVETSTTHGSISVANGGIISSGRNASTGISVLLGYLDVGTYTVSVATKNATMYVTTTGQTYPANGVSISDITSSENNSITFTLSEAKYVNLGFFVSSNIDLYCTNIQLEYGKNQTPYEKYIPTNKELWEMIKALQQSS